jgi:hypothetical protein
LGRVNVAFRHATCPSGLTSNAPWRSIAQTSSSFRNALASSQTSLRRRTQSFDRMLTSSWLTARSHASLSSRTSNVNSWQLNTS